MYSLSSARRSTATHSDSDSDNDNDSDSDSDTTSVPIISYREVTADTLLTMSVSGVIGGMIIKYGSLLYPYLPTHPSVMSAIVIVILPSVVVTGAVIKR